MRYPESAAAAELLTMVLRPVQATLPRGSLPELEVAVTNRGHGAARLCAYMADYRLKASMTADALEPGAVSFELQPFQPVEWAEVRPQDVWLLEPGEERSFWLSLNGDPVFGFVPRHSQPPVIPGSHVVSGLPPGRYRFRVALQDRVAVYRGAPGVFDRNLETRWLSELPGFSGICTGLLEATAILRFA